MIEGPKDSKVDLRPLACAQLMTAFARAKMFTEVQLFERLEALFVQRIDEADAACLVTMFVAHGQWANNMYVECIKEKKQPLRVFKVFR